MFAKIRSCHLLGITGVNVDVEVDISTQGMPSFNMVGLAETSVKESKDRVRSALKNLGYNIFAKPITINFAPADFKKEGTHHDLAVAIALLIASNLIDDINLTDTLFLGEISLDGRLRGVSGILPMVEYAKDNGFKRVILPTENAYEGSLIDGIDIFHADELSKVIGFLRGEVELLPFINNDNLSTTDDEEYSHDFRDIMGQFLLRRATEIAAAGMHNMIMIGSPGAGKTMIARRLPTILPPMSMQESIETTKIHSVAGLLKSKNKLIRTRPFISPHHTASNIAIIGGGTKAKPGHVSLANAGILFLDEMLEFNRSVLEVLRQPLEDREVTVARAGRTIIYPAKFMLVGAMNPCPCGYYGDKKRECTCSKVMIDRYRARLSGPMLDRIDIHISIQSVEYKDMKSSVEAESSRDIRKRVIATHKIQAERFKGGSTRFNSDMSEADIKKFCKLTASSDKILANAMNKYNLTARSYNKILKTSRTIADLAGREDIVDSDILEALQYRLLSDVN